MTTSLRRIAEITAQGILPASGDALPDTPLTGVHLSELVRPGQYLDGGELLITTAGFLADAGPDEADAIADAYVASLRSSGIGALALGLDVHFDRAPRELVDACARHGVPFAVIPARTRFQSLTRAFWTARIDEERHRVQRLLSFQTRLSAAVTSPDPVRRLVGLVAAELGGWAVYLPAAVGAAPAVSPGLSGPGADALLAELRTEALRGASLGPLSTASYAVGGTTALQFPVTRSRSVVGHLIAAPRSSTPVQARAALLAAASLISAAEARASEVRTQDDLHRALVVQLLRDGRTDAAEQTARTLRTPRIPDPVEVLLRSCVADDAAGIARPRSSAGVLRALFGEESSGDGDRELLFLDVGAHRMLLLDRASAAEVRAAIARTDEAPFGARLSPPIPLADFSRYAHQLLRYPESLELLGTAREGGASGGPRVDPHRGAASAEEPETASFDDVSAGEWVARLHEHSQADLVRTAFAVLGAGSSHALAAAELGVHPNTVRYRARIIAEVLGRPLSDPEVISTLWPVLRGSARDARQPAGESSGP
ncbi:PucR family transcriptional regulator [Leucobacter iarius]|uniref:PucR family transcriptional regulator n=1 Tax=Leucobacter iarius TaxID=333963 RepID=A0ABN2LPC2_9MICO